MNARHFLVLGFSRFQRRYTSGSSKFFYSVKNVQHHHWITTRLTLIRQSITTHGGSRCFHASEKSTPKLTNCQTSASTKHKLLFHKRLARSFWILMAVHWSYAQTGEGVMIRKHFYWGLPEFTYTSKCCRGKIKSRVSFSIVEYLFWYFSFLE